MRSERPFSGPVSVTLAGLTILGLGAASFTAKLNHQLGLPRPVHGARVVVIEPRQPASPAEVLAYVAARDRAAARASAPPRRRAEPPAEPAPVEPPSLAAAAPDVAVEAAAVAPELGPIVAPPVLELPPAAAP